MLIRTWILASLACGVTQFAVGTAFHFLAPIVVPSIPPQFLNSEVLRPWPEIRAYMAAYPFIYGFVFSGVFLGLQRWTQLNSTVRAGASFGAIVFVGGHLPVYFLTFLSFQVSGEIVLWWILQSLMQCVLAGMVVGLRPFRLQ
jgi:hypothetical protein